MEPPATYAALDTNQAMLGLGNELIERPLASLIRNTSAPAIYDANFVGHVRAASPREIEDLAREVDRYYSHCQHRRFVVDQRTPPEFVASLVLDDAFKREDVLVFFLEGELVGEAEPRDIRPVESAPDWDEYWELMWMDWQEGETKRGREVNEDVARLMWACHKRQQPPMQYWMAYENERPVAYFASWGGVNGVGQVENLFTHPDFRRRGYAKSLIFHCVAESRKSGADHVVITAVPDDTPKHLYAALGFRPVATLSTYLKRVA